MNVKDWSVTVRKEYELRKSKKKAKKYFKSTKLNTSEKDRLKKYFQSNRHELTAHDW
jgi:hypothetical protein